MMQKNDARLDDIPAFEPKLTDDDIVTINLCRTERLKTLKTIAELDELQAEIKLERAKLKRDAQQFTLQSLADKYDVSVSLIKQKSYYN